MATLVPSLNSCLGKMQAGEKRLARRLEALLEDDYLCWYELSVGKRQRYTDFIILHPGRGLLLLEVKDWKIDTIQNIDPVSVTLLTNRGVVISSNPLEQVRQCTYQLINQLEKDPQLVNHSGRYQGKRQRFSPLAARVARCLLHAPGQQGFNLFQRVGRRDVLQYMM